MPRASPPTHRAKPYSRPSGSPSRGPPDDGMAPALASSMAARGRGSVDDYEMSDAGSGSEQQRVKIEIDEDGDPKRKAKKGKKTKAKTVRDTKTAGTSTSSATRHGPSKKPSAWTGEEDWAMFKLVHPKAKVDWAAVALAVGNGRDAKSCSNRYYAWSKKLEAAIKTMGT